MKWRPNKHFFALISKWIFAVIFVALMTVLGACVSMRAAGPQIYKTSMGRVEVSVYPTWRGEINLYIPLADWGVRIHAYDYPLEFSLTPHSINREQVLTSLQSEASAENRIRILQKESIQILHEAGLRAGVFALIGGLVGGVFAGICLTLLFNRKLYIIWSSAGSIFLVTILISGAVFMIPKFSSESLQNPVFYAKGEELPKLLAFSEQITRKSANYEDRYKQALDSLTRLIAYTSKPVEVPTGQNMFMSASDIHNNLLVLDAFDKYADDKTVFLIGDYGQLGLKIEQGAAPRIAALGGKTIAISGNHDSQSFMADLKKEKTIVLDRAETQSDGFVVAGYPDPLENNDSETHYLSLESGERKDSDAAILAWYYGLRQKPQIVLIHQIGLARKFLETVTHKDPNLQLLVLTGHDHKAHLEKIGKSVLLDDGTLGAGGPWGVGKQSASFAEVHYHGQIITAVDFVEIEPISGEAKAKHEILDLDLTLQKAS